MRGAPGVTLEGGPPHEQVSRTGMEPILEETHPSSKKCAMKCHKIGA